MEKKIEKANSLKTWWNEKKSFFGLFFGIWVVVGQIAGISLFYFNEYFVLFLLNHIIAIPFSVLALFFSDKKSKYKIGFRLGILGLLIFGYATYAIFTGRIGIFVT